MNKSLNQGFRRKQLENIQIQNAKMLKRLQERKSDYEAQKLKEEWKKQKTVIKNLVNFPFIIRDKAYCKSRRKSMTSQSFHKKDVMSGDVNSLLGPIQLVRVMKFNNNVFVTTVKYSDEKLQIIGENKLSQ